jgi:hypothetical protein
MIGPSLCSYGDVSEIIPKDTPPPLGGFITLTHYQHANLYHDIITGHSITGWYPALHEQDAYRLVL